MQRPFGGKKMAEVNSVKILPLYFAAPVNWYAELIASAATIIAHENTFESQTLRNRLNYGTFQGSKLFTIPLTKITTRDSYEKVKINYGENWQNHLINALQTAYGKSPFFEYYGYRFEKIILNNFEYLWDLNWAILIETLNCLKVQYSLDKLETDKLPDKNYQEFIRYYQVFQEQNGFLPHLTILDLIYNEGPDAYQLLLKQKSL